MLTLQLVSAATHANKNKTLFIPLMISLCLLDASHLRKVASKGKKIGIPSSGMPTNIGLM
jgi:tetrahydromethanopterin S-methyltransferase subunit C